MKYTVQAEIWIEVEAKTQEEANAIGMELLGRGLKAVEDYGGNWAMVETDGQEEVPYGA